MPGIAFEVVPGVTSASGVLAIVGEGVRLRHKLAWFDGQPLTQAVEAAQSGRPVAHGREPLRSAQPGPLVSS